MCGYCKNELSLIDKENSEVCKYMWIEDSRIELEVHLLYATGFRDIIEINYCPMCGEKLIEGECL